MKLWLLKPREDLSPKNNLWEPWYDKAFGFVVRAESEDQARQLANKNAGDEKFEQLEGYGASPGSPNAWLDAKYSTCEELSADGKAEVIIRDYASA